MAAPRTLPPLESQVPAGLPPAGGSTVDAERLSGADQVASSLADAVPVGSGPTARSTFRDVFDDYGAYVPALLRRLGVAPADVPDLAQDVFMVVHQRLSAFRGDSTLKTWICGISLRIARNHRRRAWVRRLVLFADVEQRPALTTPFDRLELQDRVAVLDAALARLPVRERDVFVLYEVEELSMSEIARLVGCAPKTAYTRLYAARRNMTRALARGELKRRDE